MIKAVVDTNVLISGILFGGNPSIIVESIPKDLYEFCISPELKAEILIKLDKKFHLPPSSLSFIRDLLDTYAHKYNPHHKINICKDPNDNFLLELSEASRANYLVSGDRLVLELREYKNTKIISPKKFVEILKI